MNEMFKACIIDLKWFVFHQLVDVLNPYLGCQHNLRKNTSFITLMKNYYINHYKIAIIMYKKENNKSYLLFK